MNNIELQHLISANRVKALRANRALRKSRSIGYIARTKDRDRELITLYCVACLGAVLIFAAISSLFFSVS